MGYDVIYLDHSEACQRVAIMNADANAAVYQTVRSSVCGNHADVAAWLFGRRIDIAAASGLQAAGLLVWECMFRLLDAFGSAGLRLLLADHFLDEPEFQEVLNHSAFELVTKIPYDSFGGSPYRDSWRLEVWERHKAGDTVNGVEGF